jgi:ApbE superfamily uncharacterized protein (UPF0280 family)
MRLQYPLYDIPDENEVANMKTDLYIPRSYRASCTGGASVNFTVEVGPSDLFISADRDLTGIALPYLSSLYKDITSYIDEDIGFMTSLKPLRVADHAPMIIKKMTDATRIFDVGPMAAVAGAISEEVAQYLCLYSKRVIVENGGDIFVVNNNTTIISLYFNLLEAINKISFELGPCPSGMSICTSSGVMGHSLSFGNADAVTVICQTGYLADAAATALCNLIQDNNDIEKAIGYARGFEEILGVIIVIDGKIGIYGEVIKIV